MRVVDRVKMASLSFSYISKHFEVHNKDKILRTSLRLRVSLDRHTAVLECNFDEYC